MRNSIHYSCVWLNQAYRYSLAAIRSGKSTFIGDIARDGYAVIENFASRSFIDNAVGFLEKTDQFVPTREGATGTEWLYNADKIRELGAFFSDRRINDAANALIGNKAVQHRSRAQRKRILGRTGAFDQFYHNDAWRFRLKFFLFLKDVTENNGPFEYVPRSIRGYWKYQHDKELYFQVKVDSENMADPYLTDDESIYAGALLPHQSVKLFRKHNLKPKAFLVKSGTLIGFDARGLHRATPLLSGERLALESYWIEADRYT